MSVCPCTFPKLFGVIQGNTIQMNLYAFPVIYNEFVIFYSLPKGSEENEEYDKAHTSTKSCETLYPGCYDLRDDVDQYDI